MNHLKFFYGAILASVLSVLFFSCVSVPVEQGKIYPQCSREILGKGIKSDMALADFFLSENPDVPLGDIQRLARYYISECAAEGINSDIAFVQMCLETGFLRFGNLVVPEMHNYCGLGAMDAEHPGEWFATEQLGVRAHVQHLQAYATTEDVKLKQDLVDPRYAWVHKVKLARTVFELAGQWATDPAYGTKLDGLLTKLEKF